MGVCASKMKDLSSGIDKEQIEMGVKSRRVEIAEKTRQIAAGWQARIAGGETVSVSPMELLPKKDVSAFLLTLGPQSTLAQIQTIALYMVTNTLFRDSLKASIWADLEAGMKAKKLPEPLIAHFAKAAGPLTDMALDRQVASMAKALEEGRPMVTEEEARAVQAYQAKQAAAVPPANAAQPATINAPVAPATPATPADTQVKVVEGEGAKAPIGLSDVALQEKPMPGEVAPGVRQGVQFEQNTAIRA